MKATAAVLCCWLLVEVVTSATVQEASITAHNKARRAEAKAAHATNIYELIWDPHLARVAKTWADGCVEEHRNLDGYGENLYYKYPKNQPDAAYLDLAVAWWIDEKKLDTNGHFDCCFHGTYSCCHYTQVVAARSRHVGCGVATCPELRSGGQVVAHNAAYVVCFYTPMGNYAVNGNHAAYGKGTTCSACDAGDHCNDGLCVDTAR